MMPSWLGSSAFHLIGATISAGSALICLVVWRHLRYLLLEIQEESFGLAVLRHDLELLHGLSR